MSAALQQNLLSRIRLLIFLCLMPPCSYRTRPCPLPAARNKLLHLPRLPLIFFLAVLPLKFRSTGRQTITDRKRRFAVLYAITVSPRYLHGNGFLRPPTCIAGCPPYLLQRFDRTRLNGLAVISSRAFARTPRRRFLPTTFTLASFGRLPSFKNASIP